MKITYTTKGKKLAEAKDELFQFIQANVPYTEYKFVVESFVLENVDELHKILTKLKKYKP